jgi:hypothetical protein
LYQNDSAAGPVNCVASFSFVAADKNRPKVIIIYSYREIEYTHALMAEGFNFIKSYLNVRFGVTFLVRKRSIIPAQNLLH